LKALMTGLAVLLAAISQVTVAPLFPVAGAVPEIVLLTLVLLAAFNSPSPVMVFTPIVAVALRVSLGPITGLILSGVLPFFCLPLGFAIEDSPLPLNTSADAGG